MFTIEFVVVRPGRRPIVVDWTVSIASRLDEVERTAKSLLEYNRQRRKRAPDGVQVLVEEHSEVVA